MLISVSIGVILIPVALHLPRLTRFFFDFLQWGILAFVLLLFLGQFIALAIHEMGHLLFGLCVGLRFDSISIGPLFIDHHFKVSLQWKQRSGAAGMASLLNNGNHRLRSRWLFMILGGPLANLICAAAGLIYQKYSGNSSPALNLFIFFSAWMVLANLVPYRFIFLSDGMRIWLLLANRRKGERWLAVTLLVTALADGAAPDQLDKELLQTSVSFVDKSPDTVAAHALAYESAFAAHDNETAARYLETCLAYCQFTPPIVWESLFASAAIFQARRRKRVDLAEAWLAALPEKTRIPGLRTQAEAAILEAQGELEGALAKLEESRAACEKIAMPAVKTSSLASLDRWKKEL